MIIKSEKPLDKNITCRDIILSLLCECNCSPHKEIIDLIASMYPCTIDEINGLLNNLNLKKAYDYIEFDLNTKFAFIYIIKAFAEIQKKDCSAEVLISIIESELLASTCLSSNYFAIDEKANLENITINGLLDSIRKNILLFNKQEIKICLGINSDEINKLFEIYFYNLNSIFLQLLFFLIISIFATFSNSDGFINLALIQLTRQFYKSQIISLYINPNYKNILYNHINTNNTSLFEIIYSYDNGDLYNIRLDSMHKGVNDFHFNVGSFGNEKQLFPLNERETNLMQKFDLINHGLNQFYFKEKELHFLKEKIHKINFDQIKDREHIELGLDKNYLCIYLNLLIEFISPFGNFNNLLMIDLNMIYKNDLDLKDNEGKFYNKILKKMKH